MRPLILGLLCGAVAGATATATITMWRSGDDTPGQAATQQARPGGAAAGRPNPGRRGGGRGYAPAVEMATAEEAAIKKVISVIGEARALRSVAITSEVTGLVEQVAIVSGQKVKRGDVLVQVENDGPTIDLNRARAQYPIAKANAARFKELAAADAASEQEAETAFNALKTLEAELQAAEYALAQRSIAAPFDGIAGLTDIEPGDYIRAGDIVTTLDDTSSVVIQFAVPQELAAFINIGQSVNARLTSGGGVKLDGSVTALDSRIDPQSRTLRVEATVNNPNGALIPGAVFNIEATSDGAPAIAVPGLALQWDRSGAYVWKRGEDGAAVRAGVSILQRNDDIILVEGDIAVGDLIAADGADRVRRGVPLPAPQTRSKPSVNRQRSGAAAPAILGN